MKTRHALIPVLASLTLVACGGGGTQPQSLPTPEPGPQPTYTYVALGDSYAAMGSTTAGTTGPAYCLRSADNYPGQVLSDARVTGRDATCQGAVTADLLQPRQAGEETIPAQVEALGADTDLVTLSIGGNDIGFGDVAGCFLAAMQAGRPSDCAPTWQQSVDDRLTQLPERLDEVYQAIDERSDGARVITTGYLPLLGPEDDCAEADVLSQPDRAWVVTLTDQINRVVADAAQRHGAEMVLPERAGNHTGCAEPEHRWVDFFGSETGAYPMHPTPTGQEVMAQAVLEQL
ncbi:SGNH/GDSL hydrolase family protein [Corynebacterium sp. YIM 101645]|uniref:SGNH/GDSL hydrolase family protein n=1 Tax=Corynebacterium lemuris TaxID=1859292 RepID=A0ABT2FZU2_9CORY|nr:SGNH/GDSL hydrolase family protein [Corynebacterium lemuris]